MIYLTVNHSKNFVNPDTGVHTNLIENLWMLLKNHLRRTRHKSHEKIPSYIAEFCFRQKYKNDNNCLFNKIL